MTDLVTITSPVGRLVSGSVSEGHVRTDNQNQPKLGKDGQPLMEYYLGVAIPKGGESNWWETPWGQKIMEVGFAAFPQGQAQQANFAWKIVDGDSTVPNKANKIPNQQPGYAGHWILNLSNGYAPACYNANGSQAIDPKDIYRGSYVQVFFSVKGNGSFQSPGVYLNPSMVALAGHGELIQSGPDVTQAGFGQDAQLPPGASATPLAQNFANNVPQSAPGGAAVPPQQPVPNAANPGQQQNFPAGAASAGGAPQYPSNSMGNAPAPAPQQPAPTGYPAPGGQTPAPGQTQPVPGAMPAAQPGGPAPATAQPNAASPSEPYPQYMTPPQ